MRVLFSFAEGFLRMSCVALYSKFSLAVTRPADTAERFKAMKSRSGCFWGLSKGRLLLPPPHPRRAVGHTDNIIRHDDAANHLNPLSLVVFVIRKETEKEKGGGRRN